MDGIWHIKNTKIYVNDSEVKGHLCLMNEWIQNCLHILSRIHSHLHLA